MYLSVNSFFSLWTVYIMKLGYITSQITGYIKGWEGANCIKM